jgi:hypothetical protein
MNPRDAMAATVQPRSSDSSSIMVRASHALALVRCARAARLWSTKQTGQVGTELKAAARCIHDAASWLREEFKHRLCTAAVQVSAAGEKLETGGPWTREEIDKAFIVLRDAVDALGGHVGSVQKPAI